MKSALPLLCAAVLLQGCASLTALQNGGREPEFPGRAGRAGATLSDTGTSGPSVAVTPEGNHAIVMPPCGNTAVVVNPDGSHSVALINGTTATIVIP